MTAIIITVATVCTIGAIGFYAIFSMVLGEMEDKGMM